MDRTCEVLLKLLSFELFGATPDLGGTGVAFQDVKALAQRHGVAALLYRGVRLLPDVPEDALLSTRMQAVSAALRNEEMMEKQDQVLRLLSARGIACCVLKGSSVAAHYPNPELRVLGDIDLLVNADQLEAACGAMREEGYTYSHGHAFHECFVGFGAYVEIHQSVSRFSETVAGVFASDYMKTALRDTETESMACYTFPVMQASYQLISLLAHMETHMLRDGVLLRQLCDWAVTAHHDRGEFTDEMLSLLEKCGLLTFAAVVTKTCARYLGMPAQAWAEGTGDEVVEMMLDEFLSVERINVVGIRQWLGSALTSRAKMTMVIRDFIKNANQQARNKHRIARMCPPILPLFWIAGVGKWFHRMLSSDPGKPPIPAKLRMTDRRRKLHNELKMFR